MFVSLYGVIVPVNLQILIGSSVLLITSCKSLEKAVSSSPLSGVSLLTRFSARVQNMKVCVIVLY